jgi:hypothetical protein
MSDTLFETLQAKAIAGTLTPEEANINSLQLTSVQKDFLHDSLLSRSGSNWGGSTTIPTPQAGVFITVDETTTIPAAIEWTAEVIEGTGTFAEGDNTIKLYETAFQSPRVDGQAHPAITLTLTGTAKARLNYTPLA